MSGLVRRLPAPVRKAFAEAREDDLLLVSAGLAFYALVSTAPTVIIVLWLTSLVVGDDRIQRLAEELRSIAPDSIGADVALQRVSELGTDLAVPAAVAGLWPATAYGAGLRRAFERLSARRKRELQGLRGRGLAFVALLPLFVVGALVASYAGTKLLGDGLPAQLVGLVIALLLGFVGAGIAVALILKFFSPRDLPLRAVVRGTAVTAVGISLLSLAFTIYLNVGADFQKHYASSGVAGIVLLALWLYLSNALLLIGYKVAESEASRR